MADVARLVDVGTMRAKIGEGQVSMHVRINIVVITAKIWMTFVNPNVTTKATMGRRANDKARQARRFVRELHLVGFVLPGAVAPS